ncbi:DegT/DnrJ/EryC1/StrS family aminotransferase [Nocardia transvalensis]|uniref:DegT/DnrJ/EryC1/StrS family aminotransferase n=1 Tax=Nocardia transvalensis TaxID=37333 RepID=UPI00189542F3|nr:DegT/DnrJ/EryC1/StrS family aminotransferase [Nocardia transvalensis]MBF6329804.1 DegT/DnrJ/EryC1/StrS family aminotransferase [Nocardia transvalensis]
MIPVLKVAMDSDGALRRVADVLHSGRLEHGPVVDEFERELARRVGNPYAVAVDSNTSGIHLGLRLATTVTGGDEPRDGEVLSTPLTFEATNWPILACGLRIRWVDIDPATLTIDLDDLASKITPATRAISLVHWMGYPVDEDRLRQVLDAAEAQHGVRPIVVEDCAHAWGSTYRGRPLGNQGNISVFSFQAIKHLTSGSGGLVVLPDAQSHERAKRLRWFGIDRAADRVHADYDVPEWGYRFQMNEVSGAIGLANLEAVDARVERHRKNAAFYDRELANVPGLEHTERAADRESSFWMYPLKVDDRPEFMRKLEAADIMSTVLSRRNDLHSCVERYAEPLPGLDSVADRIVHIPVGWWVSDEDREHIVDTIRSGW